MRTVYDCYSAHTEQRSTDFFSFSVKVSLITIIVIFYSKSVEKPRVQAGVFLMH